MKKSNVIVFALLTLLSAFLLWLWYYLGFNHVDNPFDLVLSVVWWVAIALGIAVIARLEQVRRRRIRTVYVGDRAAFNSEKGLLPLDAGTMPVQDSVAVVLDDLEYGFTREDFPEPEDFRPRYFIRTDKFEAEKRDDAGDGDASATDAAQVRPTTWKGEVVVVGDDGDPRTFDTPEELASILASLTKVA